MIILDWNQTNREYLKIAVEKKWGSEMGLLPDPPVAVCRRIGGRVFLPVMGQMLVSYLRNSMLAGEGKCVSVKSFQSKIVALSCVIPVLNLK